MEKGTSESFFSPRNTDGEQYIRRFADPVKSFQPQNQQEQEFHTMVLQSICAQVGEQTPKTFAIFHAKNRTSDCFHEDFKRVAMNKPAWLSGCLAARLYGRPCIVVRLPGCPVVWLPGCLVVQLYGCPGCPGYPGRQAAPLPRAAQAARAARWRPVVLLHGCLVVLYGCLVARWRGPVDPLDLVDPFLNLLIPSYDTMMPL